MQRKKRCQVLWIEENSEHLSCCEYFHFVQLDFAQADLRFGQETQGLQSAAKKVIDVNKGPEIHQPRWLQSSILKT